jgi:glucosamine 6-phosphate synthetase-like amidotransferase/phosphosugar isomerase protein
MCGIFGFISSEGKGPEVARLRRIALVTQSRGDHAFGLAWLDGDGRLQTFKRPGPAKAYLDELDRCRNAVVVVGHCRFATHGSPQDNRNNHPHAAGAGFLVHNGVIHNHQQLIRRYGLDQQSQCDSEVLGLLMARCAGSIVQRSAWAANQVQGDLAMLGVWRAPARILLTRRGRPLCFGHGRDGYYFGSLPDGLPGKAKSVADHSTRVLVYDDGVLRLDDDAIRLAAGGVHPGPAGSQ